VVQGHECVKHVYGNLLANPALGQGRNGPGGQAADNITVLVHQVNTDGTYGGLAADLFERFPGALAPAPDPACPFPKAGVAHVWPVDVGRRVFVAHCVAQVYYGGPKLRTSKSTYPLPDRKADRLRYFMQCLGGVLPHSIAALVAGCPESAGRTLTVAFPHRIGCAIGGGNWGAYLTAINEFAACLTDVLRHDELRSKCSALQVWRWCSSSAYVHHQRVLSC
jgi:hypothetical protein